MAVPVFVVVWLFEAVAVVAVPVFVVDGWLEAVVWVFVAVFVAVVAVFVPVAVAAGADSVAVGCSTVLAAVPLPAFDESLEAVGRAGPWSATARRSRWPSSRWS